MKVCTKCKIEKDESEYFFRNKAIGSLHSYCKFCKRELDRNSYKIEGNKRAEKIRINARKNIKRAKEFVKNYKQNSKCSRCPETRWYVLDFHHLNDKVDSVSTLAHNGPSIKRLQKEIDKCQVVCSNCHREIHYLIRNNMVP